jgi:uncharacterized membrane protein HdeD (DUF308 family)
MKDRKKYYCVCGIDHRANNTERWRLHAGVVLWAVIFGVCLFAQNPFRTEAPVVAVFGIMFVAYGAYYRARKHSFICSLRIALIKTFEGIASPIPG